jgi:hypothetical protein
MVYSDEKVVVQTYMLTCATETKLWIRRIRRNVECDHGSGHSCGGRREFEHLP